MWIWGSFENIRKENVCVSSGMLGQWMLFKFVPSKDYLSYVIENFLIACLANKCWSYQANVYVSSGMFA